MVAAGRGFGDHQGADFASLAHSGGYHKLSGFINFKIPAPGVKRI